MIYITSEIKKIQIMILFWILKITNTNEIDKIGRLSIKMKFYVNNVNNNNSTT